jgi:50S ribosomal subunit-associated GTPase HflX
LTQKPQIVTLNKMDLPAAQEAADLFAAALDAEPVFLISAIKKEGIKRLISRILELLDKPAGG